MTQRRSVFVLCTIVFSALTASVAQAASLKSVSNWNGGVSLPADVSMYIYVPDKVATKPPVLAVIHYCGGSAQAVFGQAQGGGLVAAADQYGFILVVPSNGNASGANGRCWDVTSSKAQKRDGGGDTHAIAQMLKYTLTQYQANADRVYATGDSSGGMMTQLMLALYPDVFKAGASFAGVPAGCSNVFDGSGLCGLPAQTAQQWGDRVRAMDPGYTGHRPRVQLFHGDADSTIAFKNLAEGVKEWTNVLALPTDPTSSDNSLTLGTNPAHPASRQSWKNECGYVVLDSFTEHKDANKPASDPSAGGDHGPSDTLFVAKYVVPFLGLDKTSALDPEIEQCKGGGGAPNGGAGSGGSPAGESAAGGSAAGGSAGNASNGGAQSGGAGGTTSGGQGPAGAPGTAGAPSNGGGVSSAAGASNVAGMASTPTGDAPSGCGCVLASTESRSGGGVATLALGLVLFGATRRRRSRR